MLRLTVLSLLACAVSLSSSAVILDNGMPVGWAQTAGQLTDLPIQNDILMPNPWNLLHRMSLYKFLIANTDPLILYMGTGANESPFWGLPLQLAWMKTSGRLVDPTGTTTCGVEPDDPLCISTASWWACGNYFLSALPFLSAAHKGFMGEGVQVQMQAPEGVTEYCTTHADCSTRFPDAMTKWDAFFQALITTTASALADDEKKDAVLHFYWEAQMASTYATVACDAKKGHYSTPEMSFAKSWLNAGEFVAAAHFQSNLEKAAKFMGPLPSRILQENDVAPNIENMKEEEKNLLNTFSWMDTLDTAVDGSLVSYWKKAMCSLKTREQGSRLLEELLSTKAYSSITFMSVLATMATGC